MLLLISTPLAVIVIIYLILLVVGWQKDETIFSVFFFGIVKSCAYLGRSLCFMIRRNVIIDVVAA